jgi:hypothetical protein
MPEGVESWDWVLDFHGFGLADCDPRLARIFLNLSAAHYPERLGHFFIVSAPALFNTLWKAIQGMVDPVTREKVGRGWGRGRGRLAHRAGPGGGGT